METLKQRTFSPLAFAVFAVIIVAGFVFAGCSGGDGEASVINVTSITLAGDAEFTLAVGQNKVLDYTVQPANATEKNVSWSSSDTDVAIASEGVLYAVGEGTAEITVTTQSGYKTATCTVIVTGSIALTGMELDKTSLFLAVGTLEFLTPTFYPANATNQRVIWTSFNTGVATVTNGGVQGVASGKTVITGTTADGDFAATCNVTVVSSIPKGMVWIEAGTFMMGSLFNEPEIHENETPHRVTLTEGFYMGKYPVTQAEWEAVMGKASNISYFPDPNFGDKYYLDRGAEFPVENINWYQAIVYCNLLSMEEGLSPAYEMQTVANAGVWSTDPDDWGDIPFSSSIRWNNARMVADSGGYRLPTEAQWEYACRAGTTTPFNTGNTIAGPVVKNYEIAGGQANYNGYHPYNNEDGTVYDSKGAALDQTVPVGLFEPNAWGLYDMHGNVSEWCWDWDEADYGTGARTDPKGPATGTFRIIRGGSWYDKATYLRSAFRNGYTPQTPSEKNGFRVVRPISGAPVEE
jgi:formylglycine-generating enzyme required for sulfatase activity